MPLATVRPRARSGLSRFAWVAAFAGLIASLACVRPRGAAAQTEPSPWPDTWRWHRWPALSEPALERLALADDGSVWLRSAADDGGEPTFAVAWPGGRRRLAPAAAHGVVESWSRVIGALGSLDGFWSVDRAGRIWLGPRYFDGQRWVVLARGGSRPEGQIRFAASGILDETGRHWVPFRAERDDCPTPEACRVDGLQPFGPEGSRPGAFEVSTRPDADPFRIPRWRLARLGGDAWVLAAASYRLPSSDALTFPLLGPPAPGGLRSAGYATASLSGPDGELQALVWVEEQLREGARERHLLAQWAQAEDPSASAWAVAEDLADAPLVTGRRGVRLTAGRWAPPMGADPEGPRALWLASSDGAVAARWLGGWWVWTAEEIGLDGAKPGAVQDLVVASDGEVWLAGSSGPYRFGPPPADPVGLAYLPGLRR